MTQGRRDLLPGEVSERILTAPRRAQVRRRADEHRMAGVAAGHAKIPLPGPVAEADEPGPPEQRMVRMSRPTRGLAHEAEAWPAGDGWEWSCVACEAWGSGADEHEARAQGRAHRRQGATTSG